MVGRVKMDWRLGARHVLTQVFAVGAVALLSACSSVPDAVNPVEWYKGASDLITGRERPEVASPASTGKGYPDVNTVPQRTSDTRKDLPKALVADRSNAKYAEPVPREMAPTKPLARRAPSPADTQVATSAQGVVPPKPAVQSSDLPQVAQAADQPRVSPDRRQPTARGELGPDAPPAGMNMQPPPRADVPEQVPMPGGRKMKPIQEQFQKRLAESAQASVYPGMVEMPRPVSIGGAVADDAPIHLIPPSSRRGGSFGGGKGLAAPPPAPAPAASSRWRRSISPGPRPSCPRPIAPPSPMSPGFTSRPAAWSV
jgi:hypothetical protein